MMHQQQQQQQQQQRDLGWVLEHAGDLQHMLAASADEDPMELAGDHARRRRVHVRDGSASRPRYGDPGSRRHRRHMNDLLASEDSAYSVTDLESGEEEEGSGWQGHFISAGPKFFEGRVDMARLRRHEEREKRRRAREHARQRRQRRRALKEAAEAGAGEAEGKAREESGAEGRPAPARGRIGQHRGAGGAGGSSSSSGSEPDDGGDARPRRGPSGRAEWRRVRRRVRQALRELHSSQWLEHLERVVLAFKAGRPVPAASEAPDGFPALGVRVVDGARPALELEMSDSYWRMVAHGLSQFHRLVSRSETVSGRRVTLVRLPRSGRIDDDHTHRLCDVLATLHKQRVRIALGRLEWARRGQAGFPLPAASMRPRDPAAADAAAATAAEKPGALAAADPPAVPTAAGGMLLEECEPGYISVTDLETDAPDAVRGRGGGPGWELL